MEKSKGKVLMEKDNLKLFRETKFLGRNGSFRCTGFAFSEEQRGITSIYPITSKNMLAQCRIEVPEEDLGKFCALLREDLVSLVLKNIPPDCLPALLGLRHELDALIAKELGK